MKLYCVRHGHADLLPDSTGERQLTQQGVQDIKKVAAYLQARCVSAIHILHSHKARAVDTAQLLGEVLLPGQPTEPTALLDPAKPLPPLLDAIASWNDDTMLVGHMPAIAELVSTLLVNNPALPIVRFTPGTIVCLERIEGTHWILTWVLQPDFVPKARNE